MTSPAIIIGLAIIGIAIHMLFFNRLRRDCGQEWVRLGSPNPFLPNDARTGWEITKYVLTGCFERVPDKKVVSLGRLLPILHVVLPDNLYDPRVRILLLSLHLILIDFPSLCLVQESFHSQQRLD